MLNSFSKFLTTENSCRRSRLIVILKGMENSSSPYTVRVEHEIYVRPV